VEGILKLYLLEVLISTTGVVDKKEATVAQLENTSKKKCRPLPSTTTKLAYYPLKRSSQIAKWISTTP
jgi:hypothetical protein